jgi:hypothetical protein
MIAVLIALALPTLSPTIEPPAGVTMSAMSPGELFDVMDHARQESVEKTCEQSFDAFQRGDKEWLQRYFDTAPRTPLAMRLLITKMCVTYGAGVLKGINHAGELLTNRK